MLSRIASSVFAESQGTTAAPTFRPIRLSNPPGVNSTAGACAITSGLTYYIDPVFAITNGLVIYTDSALTTPLFTSDPLSPGFYVWLEDTNNGGATYAVDFDASGVVDTVTVCP